MPRRAEILLPDLAMADTAITAGMWLARRGAKVRAGDTVLEVLAGSVLIELPAPASGVLVRKLVREDDPLRAGQRLGVIERSP